MREQTLSTYSPYRFRFASAAPEAAIRRHCAFSTTAGAHTTPRVKNRERPHMWRILKELRLPSRLIRSAVGELADAWHCPYSCQRIPVGFVKAGKATHE
jgi:hypothetical protein